MGYKNPGTSYNFTQKHVSLFIQVQIPRAIVPLIFGNKSVTSTWLGNTKWLQQLIDNLDSLSDEETEAQRRYGMLKFKQSIGWQEGQDSDLLIPNSAFFAVSLCLPEIKS